MGQLDNWLRVRRVSPPNNSDNHTDSEREVATGNRYNAEKGNLDVIINNAIKNLVTTGITDRSQIINPEEFLKRYYDTIPTSAAGIAEYNSYLEALRNIQAQQQASYDEWYNSPLQQSVRDKTAGLNPDILGLSGSSTSSPEVGTGTPTQGLPTSDEIGIQKEQLRLQRFNQLISAVGAVANLGNVFSSLSTLPLQKSLIKSQVEAQDLANLSNFETMVGREVSSRLSDSVSSSLASGGLDIASWFSDDKNFEGIFEAYAPSDTPAFRTAYNNVRKRMQSSLGSAYEQGRITAENQGSFAAMAADPSYSADVLVQIAQLRPYMEARRELELARNEYETSLAEWNKKYQDALDVRAAVDLANNQNVYNAEYYDNMDAEKQALYDMLVKRSQGIAAKMQASIDSNMFAIYEKNHDNLKGISAAYLYSGGVSRSWYEYLLGSETMYDLRGEVRDNSLYFESPLNPSDVDNPGTNPPPITGASSSPASIRQFFPPGSVRF